MMFPIVVSKIVLRTGTVTYPICTVCEAGVRDILNEAADIPQKKLRIV
jgi:hypothetical protein